MINGLYNVQFESISENEKNKRSDEFRERIGSVITILRKLNLYSNPVFFDDLYYYYYFLSLDKIFPWLDSMLRLSVKTKLPSKKRDTDVNVEMQAYEVYENPNVTNNGQKYFWYEMMEDVDGPNLSTELVDQFFNLVNIDPNPYKKSNIVTKVGSKFKFEDLISSTTSPPPHHPPPR